MDSMYDIRVILHDVTKSADFRNQKETQNLQNSVIFSQITKKWRKLLQNEFLKLPKCQATIISSL